MNRWTVFGTSNLFGDLLETIWARNDQLHCVVSNQIMSKQLKNKIPNYVKILPLEEFQPLQTDCYIFGYSNPDKSAFLSHFKKKQYKIAFKNLIHPFTFISQTADLGIGNYIAPGVVIASNVKVGNFNVLNRCSSIGHDSQIADFNHLGPRAVVCGMCSVGNKNFLGAGSIVKDRVEIENNITLGAGAVAVKDLCESGTYVGLPAKLL